VLPGTRCIAVAALLVGAATAPATADAALAQREVCVARATLVASPSRGIPVATLLRGEQVLVLGRGEDRAWVRVKTTFGPRGWLRAGQICRPGAR
jgi:hypothetical protein